MKVEVTKELPVLTQQHALFLDVDGTLVNIAPHPDAVVVPPDLLDLLHEVHRRLGGALTLLSGRSLESLRRLLGPVDLPMIGSFGAEATLWEAKNASADLPDQALSLCRKQLAKWPGTLLEIKPFGMALHWRRAPQAEPAIRALAVHLVEHYGFHQKNGHCVVELSPKAHDKAEGLAQALHLPPFRGRLPVMVGDDEGDMLAMQLARAHGGFSVYVNTRGETRSDTQAGYSLKDPSSVRRWLRRCCQKGAA